jgi:hypothetical protein
MESFLSKKGNWYIFTPWQKGHRVTAAFCDNALDFIAVKRNDTSVFTRYRNEFRAHNIAPEAIRWANQIHSAKIRAITPDEETRYNAPVGDYDGLISDLCGIGLAVFTADCAPVFFFEKKKNIVAVAHAGWRGVANGIIENMINNMCTQYDSRPEAIDIFIAPSIKKCCYEVGEEMKRVFPEAITQEGGGIYLDLPKEITRRLEAMSVPQGNITASNTCTCCDTSFFSYRRQGEHCGRMIAFIAKN